MSARIPVVVAVVCAVLIASLTLHPSNVDAQTNEITISGEVFTSDPELFSEGEDGSGCRLVDRDGSLLRLRIRDAEDDRIIDGTSLADGYFDSDEPVKHCVVKIRERVRVLQEYRIEVPGYFDNTYSADELDGFPTSIELTSQESDQGAAGGAEEQEGDPVPYLPEATSAWSVAATPGSSEDFLSEPLLFAFYVFGFDDEQTAEENFDFIAEWYVDHWVDILDFDVDEFREVSIGRLGEQRMAFIRSEIDEPPFLVTIVRVGPNIQITSTLTFGGDITEYVGDFLEEFLEGATDDPLSLLPEISDLPRGWSLTPKDGPIDELAKVRSDPNATPVPEEE